MTHRVGDGDGAVEVSLADLEKTIRALAEDTVAHCVASKRVGESSAASVLYVFLELPGTLAGDEESKLFVSVNQVLTKTLQKGVYRIIPLGVAISKAEMRELVDELPDSLQSGVKRRDSKHGVSRNKWIDKFDGELKAVSKVLYDAVESVLQLDLAQIDLDITRLSCLGVDSFGVATICGLVTSAGYKLDPLTMVNKAAEKKDYLAELASAAIEMTKQAPKSWSERIASYKAEMESNPIFEVVPFTPDMIEAAANMMADCFSTKDHLSVAAGISRNVLLALFSDPNIYERSIESSIVARRRGSPELVGVLLATPAEVAEEVEGEDNIARLLNYLVNVPKEPLLNTLAKFPGKWVDSFVLAASMQLNGVENATVGMLLERKAIIASYESKKRGLVSSNTHAFTQRIAEEHGFKLLKTAYLVHASVLDAGGQKHPVFPLANPLDTVRYCRLLFDDYVEDQSRLRASV